VVQGPQQQEVLEDVGGAEDAVDAGAGQGQAEAVEQLGPVGHGHGPFAGPQGAAGRVVGRDHHQPAVLVEHRGRADPAGRRLGDRLRPAGPGLEQGQVALIQH
jgi:hypothetical protein